MSYQIITLNHEEKSRIVWGSFCYPDNKKDADRIASFLRYLKKNVISLDNFLIYEIETDKAFPFLSVYDHMIAKLEKIS